jgi:hypothetical protein
MKFSTSVLSSFLLSASLVTGDLVCDGEDRRHLKSASSSDVEGSAKITTGHCGLKCEWGANGVTDRRLLRGAAEEAPEGRQLKSSSEDVTGVEFDFIDCTLTYNDAVYTAMIPFPDGWTSTMTKGDGDARFLSYSTNFAIEMGEIEGRKGSCYSEGALEIEFTAPTDILGDEVLQFDGQSINVSC